MVSSSTDRFNGVVASRAIKVPCVVATSANITLSGNQTIDGVAVVTGDRVLVRAQTNAVENGIYVVDSGAWERAADWDGNRDIGRGTTIIAFDSAGDVTQYILTTADPIQIGSTAITIEVFQTQAGAALAAGTTTNAVLRWDGIDTWRQASRVRVTAQGADFQIYNSGETQHMNVTYDTNGVIFDLSSPGHTFEFQNAISITGNDLSVGADLYVTDSMYIDEKAAAGGSVAGKGQLWVRNDSPNVLVFTDDAGTDFEFGTANQIVGDIVTATPPTSEAITARLIYLDADKTDELGDIGFVGSQIMRFRNFMHGGAVLIDAQDLAGVTRNILLGDPDGATTLYYAGTQRLITHGPGILRFRSDGNTDGEARWIAFEHQDGTRRGFIGHPGNTTFEMRSEIHGALVALAGEDSLGGVANLVVGNPDGVVTLYADAVAVARTQTSGFEIADTSGNDAVLGFYSDGFAARQGYIESSDAATQSFVIQGEVHGGHVLIRAETTAGAQVTGFDFDPDGDFYISSVSAGTMYLRYGGNIWAQAQAAVGGFRLYNNSGEYVIQGQARANGGLIVVNDFTHGVTGQFQRPLTESDTDAGHVSKMVYGFTNSITAADPGAGVFKFNNADYSLATEMYIDDLNKYSNNAERTISRLTTGDRLYISAVANPLDVVVMEVTGAPTDNTGWWTVPVSHVNGDTSGLPLTASQYCVIEVFWGSVGGLPDGTVDNATLRWDTTAGEWQENVDARSGSITGAGQFQVDGTSSHSSAANAAFAAIGYGASQAWLLGATSTDDADFFGIVPDWGPADGNEVIDFIWGTYPGTGIAQTPLRFKNDGTVWLEDGTVIVNGGTIKLKQVAAAVADSSTYGQIWVNSANDQLYFTDELGNDYQISNIGAVTQNVSGVKWSSSSSGDLAAASGGFLTKEAGGVFRLQEDAAAPTAAAGYGYLWVKNDTPNILYFTDDAATDKKISPIGTLDDVQYAAPTSAFTLSNASGVQSALPAAIDTFTLEANSTYEFEGVYLIASGTTAHTVAMAFAVTTAVVTDINYVTDAWNSAANAIATAGSRKHTNAVASTVVTQSTTNVRQHIRFKGIIRVTTGGTVVPQIDFSAAPGGTNQILVGSFIRFTRLGSDTEQTTGGWA